LLRGGFNEEKSWVLWGVFELKISEIKGGLRLKGVFDCFNLVPEKILILEQSLDAKCSKDSVE
jgi:hypothetical protein